jgi:hypothetical protein
MLAQILCISVGILGINVGWRPMDDGGMEYIIQLDTQSLEALKSGEPIQSDVHPEAGDIRSYKIILGAEKPPRINSPLKSAQTPAGKNPDRRAASAPKQREDAPQGRDSASPRSLLPDPAIKPLSVESAAYNKSADQSEASAAKNAESARPWMTLILVLLCLFASLAGNVYLFWIFADLRRRCRAGISTSGQISK